MHSADQAHPAGQPRPPGAGASSPTPVRNEVSGQADALVQAGVVHGGVHVQRVEQPSVFVPPRQVVPDRGQFVNRKRELAIVSRLVRDPTRPNIVVLVCGTPGVGKSALGQRVLHRHVEAFPDGQLYAHLGSASGTASVVHDFLLALGVAAERIPVDPRQAVALYRTLTASRRLAVLLDSAHSADQVRPLIPTGPGSLTIVTCTRWLAALEITDGAHVIPLEPLNVTDALTLMRRVLGTGRISAEQSAAIQVARLCDGLPLALKVAAANARQQPTRRLSLLAAELADPDRRLRRLTVDGATGMTPALDTAYRQLPERPALVYRTLGALPSMAAEVGLLAAGAGLSVQDTIDALEYLVGASLVEHAATSGEGRYRQHDLVHLHAHTKFEAIDTPGERAETIVRVLDWYLAVVGAAHTATRHYRATPPVPAAHPPAEPVRLDGRPDALAWLAAHTAEVIAIARWARELGYPRYGYGLTHELWGRWAFQKDFVAWVQADLLGLACAIECGERDWQARMHRRLGMAFVELGHNQRAEDQLRQALELWTALDNHDRIATARTTLGVLRLQQGRLDEARELLTRAHLHHLARRQVRQVAIAELDLAEVAIADGHPEQALALLVQREDYWRTSPDDDAYTAARHTLLTGHALALTGQTYGVDDRLTRALDAMTRLDSPTGMAEALTYRGQFAEHQGHHASARLHFEQAARILAATRADDGAWAVRRLSACSPTARRVVHQHFHPADPHQPGEDAPHGAEQAEP
jgi:tetratricopeptide (TPR) repeat protein